MIGIVTDSMSCMTPADREKLNAHIVSAVCIVNKRQIPDTICEFSGPLKLACTSAPSSADYYKIFTRLSEECEGIICITTSAKVSMSYANACIAGRAIGNHRIAVIDSGSAGGAIHLMIRLCRDLEGSGAGFGDIVQIITKQKNNIVCSFSMKDLHSITRARRLLSRSSDQQLPIMNQRPICTFTPGGAVTVKDTAAGSLNELRALIEEHKSPRRLIVCYSEADMHLYELMSMLRRRFPNAEIIKRRVSLAIRIVLGDGILGLFSYGNS